MITKTENEVKELLAKLEEQHWNKVMEVIRAEELETVRQRAKEADQLMGKISALRWVLG